MQQSFTFAGHESTEWDVCITGANTFQGAMKSVGKISIPGRNGDLYLTNKKYENVSLVYPCYIAKNFDENIEGLRNFLGSIDGYARLEDTYHPDEYRMAAFSGPILPAVQRLRMGTIDITFDCKPQRFLIEGERQRKFTSSGVLTNPTEFPAKPLIRVYGTGTISIGTGVITITAVPEAGYTDIDCDSMEAYCETINCNPNIALTGYDFPELVPGRNGLAWTGSITKVYVTPRWWML